jgi:hypothetical protein
VISKRRAVMGRVLVLMLTSPLLAFGLPGLAHAGSFAALPIIEDPDPTDPPPPCPQRSDFTHAISEVIETPMVSRRAGSGTYLVVFTLKPAHAFNPPDPNGCTGSDHVDSKLGTSDNIVSGPTILQDQRMAVKELTPADGNASLVYHFKILFHKEFNVTNTLNPKRNALWCLTIDVLTPGTSAPPRAPFRCA